MTSQGTPRPKELDGEWTPDDGPDHHDYQYYRASGVAVRFHDGFEPDGELVTREPVTVHMERMDDNHWWIGLDTADGRHVAVDFHSKNKIKVLWRDEG